MDHSADFCGCLSGDGSSTATVHGWKVSVLSRAVAVEEGAVCWAWWPLSSHTQHMGALQARQEVAPGAGLDASFLSQDSSGALDDTQLMRTGLHHANNSKNIFFILFFFLIFDFFKFLRKKK